MSWRATHRHFRGGLYRFLGTAVHSETGAALAIYDDEAGRSWARPLEMFNGVVADGKLRFERIDSPAEDDDGPVDLMATLRGAARENERLSRALARMIAASKAVRRDFPVGCGSESIVELVEFAAEAEGALAEADFRYCRGCGCSENDACEGGCSWVEQDLCSACA